MSIEEKTGGPRTAWFRAITFGYGAAILVGAYFLGFFDDNGKPIGPEDWGSVLAGVFSPLAFLWLVYASLSQRAELELQRKELEQNNRSQEEQRQAMSDQAAALSEQVGLMRVQTGDLLRTRESAAREAGAWQRWYLMGLRDLHDALIDYTAHLFSNGVPLDSSDAVQAYRMDNLQRNILQAETGLSRIHLLNEDTYERVLELLAYIAVHRRQTENYLHKARVQGSATAEDIQSFCDMTNELAMKARRAGTLNL